MPGCSPSTRTPNCSTITTDRPKRTPPLPYELGIHAYSAAIALAAPFSPPAQAWREGRRGLLARIREERRRLPRRIIWMHCASLGEFEQGRPLLEGLRRARPDLGLVLTFFSPSGYLVRRDYPGVDAVWYLPQDTRSHAEAFANLLQAELGIFIKYDLWLNHLHAAARCGTRLWLVAALFRPGQVFFRPWGSWHRSALLCFETIWCQDENSAELLRRLPGLNPQQLPPQPAKPSPRVRVAPDPRFDRVLAVADAPALPPAVQSFARHRPVLVAGSTWEPDENLLVQLARESLLPAGWKLLIAPHNLREDALERLLQRLPGSALRYSRIAPDDACLEQADCLILDTMGMLSSVYAVGRAAYIGGGFGAGIHNCLEAAVYGVPLAFGPRHSKFREAVDLVRLGAAANVSDKAGLKRWFEGLARFGQQAGAMSGSYVRERAGGTRLVLDALLASLPGEGPSEPAPAALPKPGT